jgi:hypothetical protein
MPASVLVLIAMTALMVAVAVYRWVVTRHEDDFLHLEDPTGELIANQRVTASTLRKVDRLGIALTVVTGLYGLGLVVVFIYTGLSTHHLG